MFEQQLERIRELREELTEAEFALVQSLVKGVATHGQPSKKAKNLQPKLLKLEDIAEHTTKIQQQLSLLTNTYNDSCCWGWTGPMKGLNGKDWPVHYVRGQAEIVYRLTWVLNKKTDLLRATRLKRQCSTEGCCNPDHYIDTLCKQPHAQANSNR